MAETLSSTHRYPFAFDGVWKDIRDVHPSYIRGKTSSLQASRLRKMILDAHEDPNKIVAFPCSYDGLSSRLVEEAGFPILFLSGFSVSSSLGLPDAGYIAMEDICHKVQETVRRTQIPVMADGDTGYGGPMNTRRTVESFAFAGAAGVMIEDQSWPKRCGHTKGKSVVSRGEAYARIKAAVDARNEGVDIFILGRTDALILGYDEAITRAREYLRLGADAVFVEALPNRATMIRAIKDIPGPMFANIIEGGLTEELSAKDLAEIGFSAVAYPWTLTANHLKSVRKTLENLKMSLTIGSPPTILSYQEVIDGVGFTKYWDVEKRYQHDEQNLLNDVQPAYTNGH